MTTELPNQLVERLFFGIGNSRASSAMSSSNNNNSAPSVSTADSPKQELELMNQFTYYDYPHRPLSNLPTDRDVKRVVEGKCECENYLVLCDLKSNPNSHAYLGTGMRGRVITVPTSKKDVLDWLLTNWGGYDSGVIGQNEPPRSITIEGGFGRGKFGLKEKVECILDRHVQENASSLRWINPTNK